MRRWASVERDRVRPADTRNGEYVSGNFFRTFGVQPWIGRLMTDADDVEGAPPVAVMSYRRLEREVRRRPLRGGRGVTRSTAIRSR